MATPPNAIVFAGGRLTVAAMARAGVWLNLAATVAIVAAVWLLGGLVGGS